MANPLKKSFRDAAKGIAHVLRTQRNARIHLAAALLVLAVGLWLGLSPLEWAILALTICLVTAAEMVNTSLETLADAVHPDHHPLVGTAKDAAAGAVLVCAVGAMVVGLLVLGPRLPHVLGL